jgi:hypothetical protein
MPTILPYMLNLAGEYRVCSELIKRGVFATVTYGHNKSADVYAISDRKGLALRIEVKTTQRKEFVTNLTKKGLFDSVSAPNFWVLYQVSEDGDAFRDRFFVLSHKELCRAQTRINDDYAAKYLAKYDKTYDRSIGVERVRVSDVERFEDQWQKIVEKMDANAAH